MTWGAVGWFVVKMVVAAAVSYGVSRILAPEPEDVQGSRLEDLDVQTSSYGVPIPILYGSMRIAGNVIWSAGLKEHKHEEDVGGKGGGGATKTTYTYTCSFALGICEGEISDINRIWMDGKLFQDKTKEDIGQILAYGTDAKASSVSVYTGTETQEPDPVIESHEGEGNVPAYRGLAYIVFEDLELGDYANRIPNIEVEITDGLSEGHLTFEIPSDARDIMTVFKNGYLGLAVPGSDYGEYHIRLYDPTNQVSIAERTYEDLGQGIQLVCADWGLIHSDMMFYLSGRYEGNDGMFAILDATTMTYGSYVVESSGIAPTASTYWPHYLGQTRLDYGSIGYLSEFGRKKWIYFEYDMHNKDAYYIVFTDISTQGAPELIDYNTASLWRKGTFGGYSISGKYNYIQYLEIFNDRIYICFDYAIDGKDGTRILYEYLYFENIPDGSDNIPGNYNRKSDVTNTSDGRFVAVTPDGDFITRDDNDTTCYIHVGMGPETRKTYSLSTTTQSLDSIVGDLVEKAGLGASEYDVSDLSDQDAIGFAVTRPMSVKDAIKPLIQGYQFDLVEAEGQIKCVSRGQSVERSFAENELAAHEQGSDIPAAVESTRAQENQLPTKVTVKYKDQDSAYQIAAQYAKRVTQEHDNHKVVKLPLVTTADHALQTAEKLLASAWAGRNSYSLQVLSENIDLLPGSSIEAAGYRLHVEEMSTRLPSIIEIQGTSEEPSSYTSDSAAVSPVVPDDDPPGAIPISFSAMMNLPGIETVYSTPGFFVAPYVFGDASSWSGAVVYKTNDGGDTWLDVDMIFVQTLVAKINSAPGVGPTTRWDNGNYLTITPLNDRSDLLTSVSKLSALAGSNTAAIGSSSGEWEIISYLDVTDNGDGTYTLSGLLRGRRGTEDALSAPKDLFVLLKKDGLAFVPVDPVALGDSKDYKVVSIGKSITDKSANSHTSNGDTVKPWSPVHIVGKRNDSGDLTITWFRRSRAEGGWNRGDIPLFESQEKYEIDILDGCGNVVRTLSTSGEDSDETGVTYTASQQTDDFGSVQSTVAVAIYQISDIVGRGFIGKATGANFKQQVAKIIDDFERDSLDYYSGATDYYAITSTWSYCGSYSLGLEGYDPDDIDAIYSSSGLGYYPQRGDTIRYVVRYSNVTSYTGNENLRFRFRFARFDFDNYYEAFLNLHSGPDTSGELGAEIRAIVNGSIVASDSVSLDKSKDFAENENAYIQIDFRDAIRLRVFKNGDWDSGDLWADVSITDSNFDTGGIAFWNGVNTNSEANFYHDFIHTI